MNNTITSHKRNTHPTFSRGLSCLLVLTFLVGMLYNLPLGDASAGVKNTKPSKTNPPKKIAFFGDNLWEGITSGVGSIGVNLGSSVAEMGQGIVYALYKYILEEQKKIQSDPILNTILPIVQTYCKNHRDACKEIGNGANIIDKAKKEADSIEKKLKKPCKSNMENIGSFTKNPITIIILTRKCYGTISVPSGTKMNMSSNSGEDNQEAPKGSGDALTPEQRNCLNDRMKIAEAGRRQAEALKKVAEEKARQEAQQQARDKNRRDYWDAEFKKIQKTRERELQDRIKCLEGVIQGLTETLKEKPRDKQALQKKRYAQNEIQFLKDVIKQLLDIAKEWDVIKNQSGENLTKKIDYIVDLYRRNAVKVYNWNPDEPMNSIVPAPPRK